jgi:hypothetical protein
MDIFHTRNGQQPGPYSVHGDNKNLSIAWLTALPATATSTMGSAVFLQRMSPRGLHYGGRRHCKALPAGTLHMIIDCRTGFYKS